MPNWVFNTINGYNKELYDKYKSEDTDIDFNKIIPEPEDITNAPSGSFNTPAKNIYNYKNYLDNKTSDIPIRYDRSNPLYEPIRNMANNTAIEMGNLAIENPDKSLNELFTDKNHKLAKSNYDKYVSIFGNNRFNRVEDHEKMYENYVNTFENNFKNFNQHNISRDTSYSKFDSLYDLGKHLTDCEEKYGFDNWYDWRVANWGTKWNACDSSYDEESETLRFDTAWAIPYPILTKLAHDNPDVRIDGYSEEETGWFDEYHSNNGKIIIDNTGEEEYDEEKDEYVRNSQPDNRVLEFDSYLKSSVEDWKNTSDNIDKIKNYLY